jgi:serine/threonine-protein kinase RsbW
MLRALGKSENIKEEVLAKCSLALVEAVNNAIFHAHGGDGEKWIEIGIRFDGCRIEMEVADSGAGFEMPPDSDLPLDVTHGRGLFIIRSVMDEVRYRRGRKNVLKMALGI